MAGEADGGGSALPHVERDDAGRLGRVHHERHAMGAAGLSDGFDGQDRAADVACVRHHNEPRPRGDEALHLGGLKGAVLGALRAAERHAPGGELRERPHDGVVLHARHDHVVTRRKPSLEDEVYCLGHVPGEDDVRRVYPSKQLAERASQVKDHVLHVKGRGVLPAANVGASLGHVSEHGLCHAGRLWKCGACVVQVGVLGHGLPRNVCWLCSD